MQTTQPDLAQIKQRMRAMWEAGDFGKVAVTIQDAAEEWVGRLGIKPGMRVLDVACGTGNLSIPAARLGAEVTGIDIAANLVEQARARAAAEKLNVHFDHGDAEQMPYPDNSFDLVMSMFGAMFAPRPERAAAELLRVTRPGGRIALANWTPEGFIGKMFALGARHVAPPEGVPPPILWGDEKVASQRLGAGTSMVATTRRTLKFDFPFGPAGVVEFFREYFGPIRTQMARLDPAGQAAYAADLERLWASSNEATGDHTVVTGEFLEVLATRA
jgi:SAM-dependent methyltransferase